MAKPAVNSGVLGKQMNIPELQDWVVLMWNYNIYGKCLGFGRGTINVAYLLFPYMYM